MKGAIRAQHREADRERVLLQDPMHTFLSGFRHWVSVEKACVPLMTECTAVSEQFEARQRARESGVDSSRSCGRAGMDDSKGDRE